MSPQQSHDRRPGPFVVAIDGPAASGKGTLARRLAEHFGLAHLDTGRLYRATAFLVLEAGGDPADPAVAAAAARRVDAAMLGAPRLAGEAVSQAASIVAAIPAVREALLAMQRDFAAHPPGAVRGAVLDGRDIGTLVCPDAAVKLFVTASPKVRARRRFKELQARGAAAIYRDVLQDMKERDARDSLRRVAPLAAAPDAVILDTSRLDADQAFGQARDLIARALAAHTPTPPASHSAERGVEEGGPGAFASVPLQGRVNAAAPGSAGRPLRTDSGGASRNARSRRTNGRRN